MAAHLVMPAVARLMAADLPACIAVRSAASVTEAMREHFPLAADRALAAGSMEVTAEEVIDENDAGNAVTSIAAD